MANDTMTIKVGDIGKVLMCKRILKNQTSDTGKVPFYKISTFGAEATTFVSKEIYEEYKLKYSYPKKGDILISAAGTVGKTVIFDGEPGYFQDSNIVWVDNDEKVVINKYLYYYYQTSPWRTSNGSTITRIYNDDLRNMEISYPSIANQRNIARVLQTLDDKIALNNKINAELEQTARLIYDYWFTQFDFPDAQGKPYKSSGGAMVYNDQLKRKIPTDWNHIEIGDISQLIRGVSYNKTQIENTLDADTVKILRATNITGNTVDIDEPVLVSKSLVEPKQFLNKYDILMTMSSGSIEHIGKNGFYYLDEKVAFGAFCAKILPKINHRFYLYMFMQSAHLKVMIKNECLGTNINNLNASMVNGFKLVGPDSDTISAFNKTVEPMFREIENNVRQNQQLAQLRDWLLPMLMTGQVKVL